MRDAPTWPQQRHNHSNLVARFADFYQELAAIKTAQTGGWLAAYLASGDLPQPVTDIEFAKRVNARLLARLQRQARRHADDTGTPAGHAAQQARYLMAALADEVLIFELDWPGRDAWLSVLLEHTMFDSSNAGSRFFVMAEQLVGETPRTPLQAELASVFLLAMELGFKGRYRSRQAQPHLEKIRGQLYEVVFVAGGRLNDEQPAFANAYAYPLTGRYDERLAPLSPWRNLALYGLIGYLVLSLVAWFVLMHPFEHYLNS
ncbi:type VI secretion system protein ImpK [Robbsia andropogonis]|uniref:DotU family type IV/VI secretion system protein n=1 Tax=Robbsia andropogonis TaxID=28092 RepID=UPI003D219C5F